MEAAKRRTMLFIFLLACVVASQAATAGPVPLVMWHGMGESVTPTVAPCVINHPDHVVSRLIFTNNVMF